MRSRELDARGVGDVRVAGVRAALPLLVGVASGAAAPLAVSVPAGLAAQGYRHLEARGRIRSTRAGFASTGGRFTCNGDISAGYQLRGGHTTGASGAAIWQTIEALNVTSGYFGQIPAATATALMLSRFVIEMPYALDGDGTRRTYNARASHYEGVPYQAIVGGILPFSAPVTSIAVSDDVGSALDPLSTIEIYALP